MKMLYELRIAEQCIVVIATGAYEPTDVTNAFKAAIQAALKHKLSKILVDARNVAGTISTMQRFDIAEGIANFYHEQLRGHAVQIAVVGHEPLIDPDRFGQTVAVNRGVPMKVTTDYDEALAWLQIERVD